MNHTREILELQARVGSLESHLQDLIRLVEDLQRSSPPVDLVAREWNIG